MSVGQKKRVKFVNLVENVTSFSISSFLCYLKKIEGPVGKIQFEC